MSKKTLPNRLSLNFSLETMEERVEFVTSYLNDTPTFQKKPPTHDELETISNYILWGKDSQTGLNAKQSKEIQLETKHHTWDVAPIESLDALLEMPGFSENMIRSPEKPALRQSRIVFSREEAREKASPIVLRALEKIWDEIDELDLMVNFYDLRHNRRKEPPRATLLERFAPDRIEEIQRKAAKLNQYTYLKKRHLLVELRREQFVMRDTYAQNPLVQDKEDDPTTGIPPILEGGITVFPVGLKDALLTKLFPEDRHPIPQDFSPEELEFIVRDYWKRQDTNDIVFDFRNLEHVYHALLSFEDFEDASGKEGFESTAQEFLRTLEYYVLRAELPDIQQDILALKLRRYQNQQIADFVNSKYKKTYNPNYISTIFRHRIIPQINAAARLHEEIVVNLPFPENFKECRGCGKILLINAENFVRKIRASDGFATQCKKCEKEKRKARKERQNGTKAKQ